MVQNKKKVKIITKNSHFFLYSKTTLLKCIAELIPYDEGHCKLFDKGINDYSIPVWRSRVMYVPQRPATHPGTPMDFLRMVKKYASQKNKELDDPVKLLLLTIQIKYLF